MVKIYDTLLNSSINNQHIFYVKPLLDEVVTLLNYNIISLCLSYFIQLCSNYS